MHLFEHLIPHLSMPPYSPPSVALEPVEAVILELLLDRSDGGLPHCAIESHVIFALMRKRAIEDASPQIASLVEKGYVRTESLRITRLLSEDEKMVWETGDLEDIRFIFLTPAAAAWGQSRGDEAAMAGRASP